MSSTEEQLRQDIAAVTKGIVVTETELLDASNSVKGRIDSNRRRARRRTVALVAAAAVVVAGVGIGAYQSLGGADQEITPAGSGPSVDIYEDFLKGAAPTPDNLNGFWRVDNGTTMVRFQTDGTVQFSEAGEIVSSPDSIGNYQIDGDQISVTFTGSGVTCRLGDPLTMRAALPEPGLVNVVLPFERLGTCESLATTIALEQVVPVGPGLARLGNGGVNGWQPVTSKKVIYGDWMAEGGGYLLELTADGSYYVVDDSTEVVDKGEWSLGDSGPTLTSSADSALCRRGDRFVLGNLEHVGVGTTLLRGTVEENDCGGGWTPDRWILIPDATS